MCKTKDKSKGQMGEKPHPNQAPVYTNTEFNTTE